MVLLFRVGLLFKICISRFVAFSCTIYILWSCDRYNVDGFISKYRVIKFYVYCTVPNRCKFIFSILTKFIYVFHSSFSRNKSCTFWFTGSRVWLVSGFNVEYAATTFVLFFLSEYSNILIMCCLISIFFFGGWLPFFFFFIPGWFWMSLKVCLVVFFFILIRALLPRYRYDQLMNIGWKVLLPISFVYFFLVSLYVYLLDVTFIF
jgi:NADH:ubiquinone oxidoreductase subunit H